MQSRETLIKEFLQTTEWADATRTALAADASGRSYERLKMGSQTAMLMNAPYEAGEDVRPFISVTDMLANFGLHPPSILARDVDNGFLILTDMGNDLFARVCESNPTKEDALYSAAVDVLTDLHQHTAPVGLKPYDLDVYIRESNLLSQWYLPTVDSDFTEKSQNEFEAISRKTFEAIPDQNPVLVMRDYHAENLLWLPDELGVSRVGLLDYQDALAGHPAYDLVSLLEDARRDTSQDLRDKMLSRYIDQSGVNADAFLSAYSILGAQRNIKIIGIFARLSLRDGKAHYVDLIPRVWDHLMRDLAHPNCADLANWIETNVPQPTPENLQKLVEKS